MSGRDLNEILVKLSWLHPDMTFEELRDLAFHPPVIPIEKQAEKPVVKPTTRKVTKTRKVVLPAEK